MALSSQFKSSVAATLLAWSSTAAPFDPQPPVMVSVRWDNGEPAAGGCGTSRFSPSNRFLSFGCNAGDLVPNDSNVRADTFVLDRGTEIIERVSVSSDEMEMPYDSFSGIPSDDGDRIIFTGAGPLHPDYGPPPPLDVGHAAVYLRHRFAGLTDLISRAANGQALTSSANFSDAHHPRTEILFGYGGNLFVGPNQDPMMAAQIWIRNWTTGELDLISETPDGQLSNGGGQRASFSATGRYTLFESPADDLGPPARFGDYNLYLHDRDLGTTERLTFPWEGGEFQAPFYVGPTPAHVTADGRFVVFETPNGEIHPDAPADGGTYVYLLDRQSSQLELLSITPDYPSYNIDAEISDDGRYVAWSSRNSSFHGPPNPPTDMRAIWVLDRQTGERVNVAEPLGPLFLDNVINIDLSPDGSIIAFTWRVGDEVDPVFGRTLLYTAQLRGTPPPVVALPVPLGGNAMWGALSLLLAAVACRRIITATTHSDRNRKASVKRHRVSRTKATPTFTHPGSGQSQARAVPSVASRSLSR